MPDWLAYLWYEAVYWLSTVALTIGFSLRIVEQRLKGHLRVDDDVLATGELHDNVRPQHSIVGRRRGLR